jgi:hypothetical protein
MDDYQHQPIWPMVQGAANYAWNLIEEAWGMIWRPAVEPQARVVKDEPARALETESEMREVELGTTTVEGTKQS